MDGAEHIRWASSSVVGADALSTGPYEAAWGLIGGGVDIEKLREFVALSESMNFTKTARALNISQPALSKHIVALEREVGFSVLQRDFSNREARLTPAGLVLLERTRGLVDDWDRALKEARAVATTSPPARIQGLYYCINLNPQINQAVGGHAGAVSRLYEYVDVAVDIRTALDGGLVDFVIHHEPLPDMVEFANPAFEGAYSWIPLDAERLCFVSGMTNPLVRRDKVTLEDVMRCPVVNQMSPAFDSWYASLTAILGRHGYTPRFRLTSNNPRDGMALPIGEDGVFLCTERMAAWYRGLGVEESTVLDVVDFDEEIYLFLVYRRDNANENVARMALYLKRQS